MSEQAITPQSESFSDWYNEVIRRAELVDYGPVKGTMVIRPYGYAIWEHIRDGLDGRFKATGHENAYFPLFIPYSFLQKEAEHVEGFSPELALVTHAGGKELEEPLVVRPTSETIINHMYSKWIQSYRDLPLLINQWANVVRWEMRTRPFLRTSEFLWQEGHTAHASEAEARGETLRMLEVYREFAVDDAAIPVIPGRKSNIEKFAGAVESHTIEAMMRDGKALQSGTSHFLGQNFAKAFDTKYLTEEGNHEFVWQTSWGVSTRMVGGVIMTHGDDKGLILPPKLAPTQVIIVPIWRKEKEKSEVLELVEKVEKSLRDAGIRVKADVSDQETAGWKFNEWEMRGVPLRIEIGPRDVEKDAVVFARRDRPGKEGKEFGIASGQVAERATEWLQTIQRDLLRRATEFRDSRIASAESMDQLDAAVAEGNWARVHWNGTDEQEREIKERTGATIRCYPRDEQNSGTGKCIISGETTEQIALFAKAY